MKKLVCILNVAFVLPMLLSSCSKTENASLPPEELLNKLETRTIGDELSYRNIGNLHNECMDSVKNANITEDDINDFVWGYLIRRSYVPNTIPRRAVYNQLHSQIMEIRWRIENDIPLGLELPDFFDDYADSVISIMSSNPFNVERATAQFSSLASYAEFDTSLSETEKQIVLCCISIANASFTYGVNDYNNSVITLPRPLDPILETPSIWGRIRKGLEKDFWGATTAVMAGIATGAYEAAILAGAAVGPIVATDALVGGILGSATP